MLLLLSRSWDLLREEGVMFRIVFLAWVWASAHGVVLITTGCLSCFIFVFGLWASVRWVCLFKTGFSIKESCYKDKTLV